MALTKYFEYSEYNSTALFSIDFGERLCIKCDSWSFLDEKWRRNATQSRISVLQFEIKPASTHPDVEKEEQLI